MMRKSTCLVAALLAALLFVGCGGKDFALGIPDGDSTAPDTLLFERAMADLEKSRYTVARLELQTLMNTYPDSEYLAKAKLAVADSYYMQAGTTGLTQSIAEYQDFITFFPFLDEAAYAQSQIGMSHFRRMEKPDRDQTEALEAEAAFQRYLQEYPEHPMRAEVEQRLREVQEVLAEGEYRVANFYYIRESERAAASRLLELVDRYPLFSRAHQANWMLARVYERTEHGDFAAQFYARIVSDYPLSPLAAEARVKLVELGKPVPDPDPTALARMETEQSMPRNRPGMFSLPLSMLRSAPDVSMAARVGTPTLTPPSTSDNSQTLLPGNLAIGGAGAQATAIESEAFIETVTPGFASSEATSGTTLPLPVADSSPSNGSAGSSSSGDENESSTGQE